MTKDLMHIIGELNKRGLKKEAKDLYCIFQKIAFETIDRAEKLVSMANPARNANPGERRNAMRRLVGLLRDASRSEFGIEELAQILVRKEIGENSFVSPAFFGEALTPSEMSELKRIFILEQTSGGAVPASDLRPGGNSDEWNNDSWNQSSRRRHDPDWERKTDSLTKTIDAVIEWLNDGYFTPSMLFKIHRINGYSDALPRVRYGDKIWFLVPLEGYEADFFNNASLVSENPQMNVPGVGRREYSVEELMENNFIGLNEDRF
jgi:hypothetical protein